MTSGNIKYYNIMNMYINVYESKTLQLYTRRSSINKYSKQTNKHQNEQIGKNISMNTSLGLFVFL